MLSYIPEVSVLRCVWREFLYSGSLGEALGQREELFHTHTLTHTQHCTNTHTHFFLIMIALLNDTAIFTDIVKTPLGPKCHSIRV